MVDKATGLRRFSGNGDQYVISTSYEMAVARGDIPGARPFGGFGERTTAGAETNVLWANGAYAFPAAAGVQMSVVSTSVNDASAGTGLRTIDIHYLDANLAEQVETVTLNGTTPVLTVATNIRFINEIHALTCGSGKVAAGNISASNAGQAYGYVAAGGVRDTSSVRMVPAGKRLLVHTLFGGSISGTAAAKTTLHLATPNFGGHDFITYAVFIPLASGAFQDSSAGISIPTPLAFTAGQAVGMTFTCDKAAEIVGSWFGLLENA